MKLRRFLAAGLLACCSFAPTRAFAAEPVEAFGRVVVEETVLRSGPGISHRVLYVTHRGETFVIDARSGVNARHRAS